MSRVTDINTDTSCSKAVDPDMALRSSLGLDDILALSGRSGHSDQDGSGGGLVHRHQQSHRLQTRPQTSMETLVTTWVLDFNTDPVFSSSQVWMSLWTEVAVHATQIGMDSVAVWPSNTNTVPGGSPEPRNLHGSHRHQHRPWLHP